jgi:putative acetyltransferase
MMIREEQERDHASITAVIARAFAGVEHSDKTEPKLVEKLRASGDLTVSLVAVVGNTLVGHVAFSPIAVAGTYDRWFGLAPVSVEPDQQQRGIGSALIRAGLERLRLRGAAGCVVLGNPAYYRRFGFERNDGLRYEGAPPEYFMCLKLNADVWPTGLVAYAASFTE